MADPMLGSGPSEIVPVRLDFPLKRAVDTHAEAEHRRASEIIREALRRFLDVALTRGPVTVTHWWRRASDAEGACVHRV